MKGAAPTHLRLKLPEAEMEFNGSEALLKSLLPKLLREVVHASDTADNIQTKAAILKDIDELQQNLDAQDEIVHSATQLIETMAALHERANDSLAQYFDQAAAARPGEASLLAATKLMQETQMSFNLQYLELQSQMQQENRSYTAISNIMKTKHDTVKNSISNIR
jgi:hypothetical protein